MHEHVVEDSNKYTIVARLVGNVAVALDQHLDALGQLGGEQEAVDRAVVPAGPPAVSVATVGDRQRAEISEGLTADADKTHGEHQLAVRPIDLHRLDRAQDRAVALQVQRIVVGEQPHPPASEVGLFGGDTKPCVDLRVAPEDAVVAKQDTIEDVGLDVDRGKPLARHGQVQTEPLLGPVDVAGDDAVKLQRVDVDDPRAVLGVNLDDEARLLPSLRLRDAKCPRWR